MMMRRTSLTLVLVVALAGCSSGSSDNASSSKSTSPKVAASSASPKAGATKTSPKPSPTSVKLVVVKVTDFCSAFKQLQNVKATNGAKVAGAAYQKAADDMRKYAPSAIKSEANDYADLIESSGKALTTGGMPTAISAKPKDLAKVTVWVSKNCKK